MRCTGCGTENPDRARFCLECAAPFSSRCASCGTELAPSAKFCFECAHPVGAGTGAAPGRDRRAYTPKHLADRILQSKSALEGERKQVTVLFCDIQGSMDLQEGIDAEEWHRIMDRFFGILADGVHRFEGTVNQYLGDGIMALFGAPIAHEDHAQRGCYAALHLTEELRHYANELRLSKGFNFSVRMGLNSGDVIVGKIGDDLRMDYTAQGHTVGLAARMQQIAEAGKVYLTEETAALVAGFFELSDLGTLQVKGAHAPLRVHELRSAGAVRTRLDVARARGFSRFVGREREITALENALAQASEGNGQVVGVVGEAGVGKSRLCFEFVELCRVRGITILDAHCPPHGRTIPFLPLLELLRGYFGITEQDDDQAARERITGRLLLLDEAYRDTLPHLFELLGVADPARPAPSAQPEARQRHLHAFFRRLVQTGDGGPTVLLVDDLHWIDPGSDAFLAQFVEAVTGTQTLVLVNFRPEYHADWMAKSYYRQVPVLPLGREAIEELILDQLG
ncbi:MAG: AAA family ATPase, partial [Myxococcota bacterium]